MYIYIHVLIIYIHLLTNYKFALKSEVRRKCDDNAIEMEKSHFISISLRLKLFA